MPGRANESDEPFGQMLRRLRERAGMTQQELAEQAGLTPHAVSALERGTRTRPYPHTVRSLADALHISEAERADMVASVPRRPGGTRGVLEGSVPAAASQRAVGLTVPATALYGREQDVEAVTALIRAGARLVTLTGPGGVGKTRLASELCRALADDFPGGVLQVSLASLADATDVMATTGRAIGVVGSDGADALEAAAAHLATDRVLLVLDNFEHLLTAATDVARLSLLCPELVVLVSSRSPLRVRGEREYAVEPLALPPPDAVTTDQLETAPAGALVLDRSRALAPRAELAPDAVTALAQLCHRLSGLPLAIELATAQLRLLSPQMLLERLDDLTTAAGERDLPERQRTMRATLDWSFGLLSPEQQRLFRLLGVFRGGATLETLEDVAAAAETVPADEVLELLGQLVEQSLVVVRAGIDGPLRYDLLEPVGQYARSLLIGEEMARSSRAHAEVFALLAEQAAVEYETADQVAWLARTEAEEANLLVAVDRSLDTDDGESAARITWSLWLYWWLRGQVSVGRRRAEQCLPMPLPPGLEARVHLTAATMSYAGGDSEASAAHWGRALALGRADDDAEVICKAASGVGLAALSADDTDLALAHFREALDFGVRAGEAGTWLRSLTHVWLGTVLLLGSDHEGAVVEIERGLDLARSRGDRLSTYVALYNLSQVAIATGDHAGARSHLKEGIRLSEQTQDRANLAYFLEALAVVESSDGHAARVALLLGAVQALRHTVGANVYAYYRPDTSLREAAEREARAVLGPDAYAEAFAAGGDLGLPDLVRTALGSV